MEAEDLGVAVLKFKNGALGTIEGSTVTYPENLEGSVALFGEKGSVKVGGTALNRKVLWKLENELQHESELIMHDQVDPSNVYGQSHKLVFIDMIHAIMEGRDPKTDGIESRKSLALVLALYESSRSGREFIFGKE
jgi:predicted dehydrogenase